MNPVRCAEVTRTTKETDISLSLCLDGGETDVMTGIGFFDHMLTAFSVHSGFGLSIRAEGDLLVDGHHTVEDTGIVLGQAFGQALGDKSGIARFGSFFVPMDESLCFASVDVSGRPFLVFDDTFPQEKVGDFDSCLAVEFFRAFAMNAGITLHLKVLYGENDHHKLEAMFKAFAKALSAATRQDARIEGVLSTTGSL